MLTLGTFIASLAAGGTDTAAAVSSDRSSQFESTQAFDAFGAGGTAPAPPPQQQLLLVISTDGGPMDSPQNAAAIEDIVAQLGALRSTVDGATVATADQIVDPFHAPPDAHLVSPDRTAVRIPSQILGDGDALAQRLAPIPQFLTGIRSRYPGLAIHALNNHMANEEVQHLVNGGLDASLRLTIPRTFLILRVAFGAVIAAVVPLVMAIT